MFDSPQAIRDAQKPPARQAAEPEAVCTLETSIDVAGNPCAERLTVYRHKIVVSGAGPDAHRQWRLDEVAAFRVEPLLGSSFLQAKLDGAWIDVLRLPGGVEPQLTALVERLNERGGRPLDDSRTGAADEGAPAPHWNTTGRLLAMLMPFQGSVLLLLALSVGAVAIEVAPPMLQRELVDRVLQADVPKSDTGQLLMLLMAIVAGLLLVRLAATLVGVWKGVISSRVGTSMTANLRNQLVAKLNELPLGFHNRNQVGMLMSRVAYDTETLHTLVYHMTSGLLLQSLQLVGIGVMLFYLNAKLALVTMLPMPLILAGSWYFTRYLYPRHNHYWEAVGKQASALTGMLSGIRVVKAFVQEDREVRRFCDSSRRLRDSRQTVDISTSTFAALMGFLFALGGLAVWYIGGRDVLFGGMSLGSLMAFLAYLAMFYAPLTSIAESTTWFSNFFAISRRIFDLLDTPGEAREPEPTAAPAEVAGAIEFQQVAFGYDKNREVLHEVSFAVRPGEMIGIVGRSGSGKSTLVSLIGRLYEADAGRVLVDGRDVRQIHPRQLRRRIGMVPQEPFLFRGAVAENVTYGNAGAAPEQVLLAAKRADAHDFIMRMPLGYDTQLGEGGSGLSAGERQRLSIARALLVDPAILILDEATASVDAESERAICEAIRHFARRRTTIAVAHRLSTLRDADRLLVFDQGRLVEQGTHQELLARDGLYSTLVHLQGSLKETSDLVESVVAGRTSSNGDGHHRDAASELRWLDPAAASIVPDLRGGLCVTVGGRQYAAVWAVRAFPASHEDALISLRYGDPSGREVELGLIARLDAWPALSQEAIRRSLGRRYLLRQIREVRQVRTSGSTLVLSVVTDAGPARLQLEKAGEGFQSFGPNGLLLIDAAGNYYVIADRNALPKRQQRLLALYVGD